MSHTRLSTVGVALSAAAFAVSGQTSLFSQGGCCSVCGLCCLFSASIFGSEPVAVVTLMPGRERSWVQSEGPVLMQDALDSCSLF